MYEQQNLEDTPSYPDVINLVGTFLGSFVLVIVLISGCVACRRIRKRDRTGDARNNQDENEYQIPEVNIRRGTDESRDGANVYSLPEPNIVYTDLDKLALKSGGIRSQPSDPPTQYAVIDEERLNAARKQRQERIYQNVDNENDAKMYANV